MFWGFGVPGFSGLGLQARRAGFRDKGLAWSRDWGYMKSLFQSKMEA